MNFKRYLGDSVYVDFDGWNITLTTENGYPDDPRNVIHLDPSVYESLLKYVDSLKALRNSTSNRDNQ